MIKLIVYIYYNFGYSDGGGDGGDEGACGGDPPKPRELYIPPDPTDNEQEMFGSGISTGINFAKYEKIDVKVSCCTSP